MQTTSTDSKYYTNAVSCYEAMLAQLKDLDAAGKFESTFKNFTVETALSAFKVQLRSVFHDCMSV